MPPKPVIDPYFALRISDYTTLTALRRLHVPSGFLERRS